MKCTVNSATGRVMCTPSGYCFIVGPNECTVNRAAVSIMFTPSGNYFIVGQNEVYCLYSEQSGNEYYVHTFWVLFYCRSE